MVELYARQQQLNLDIPESVTIVGCGGIGSWVAIFAAMSGIETLYIFDPDVLEESNRNRLPFCTGGIGRPKVEVVADYIRAIRPECSVVAIPEKLDEPLVDIIVPSSRYVIECTDSPKSQIRLFNACKIFGTSFIRAGYDGTRITVTGVVSGWIKDEESVNYTVNPSWVVPAATVAALAIGKVMKYQRQEVNLDIEEIGSPLVERSRRVSARCRQKV